MTSSANRRRSASLFAILTETWKSAQNALKMKVKRHEVESIEEKREIANAPQSIGQHLGDIFHCQRFQLYSEQKRNFD